MPGKLRKMIGVVVLVCSICGVSCVGMVDTMMGGRAENQSLSGTSTGSGN